MKTLVHPSAWLGQAREWALLSALVLGTMGLVFHGYGQPLAVTILGFCSLTLGVVNARLTIMGLLSYAFFKGAIQCP